METNNQNEKTPYPENEGKVPSSGVMSETYKEEVNSQDELGSSSNNPRDPEESQKSIEENLDSYPLEEADISEKNIEEERYENNRPNNNEEDVDFSETDNDDFKK